MNALITRKMLAKALPDRIRGDLPHAGIRPDEMVQVTVSDLDSKRPPKSRDELLAMLRDVSRDGRRDERVEDVEKYVSELRDEWDR